MDKSAILTILRECQNQIHLAWKALGVKPEDATDDPDTATLAGSITASLEYERGRVETAHDALSKMTDNAKTLRNALASLVTTVKRLYTAANPPAGELNAFMSLAHKVLESTESLDE